MPSDDRKIMTVSEVNLLARTILEQFTIWVVGEVEEFKDSYNFVSYFKLKDGDSSLPCMFWKSEGITYVPKDGEKVLAFGTLTIWEKAGRFQLKVSRIEPFGEGDLLKQREKLRKKLAEEGLFAEEIKRKIPELPQRIGLITSMRGAAIQDFLTNVVKAYEGIEIYFVDTLVQGDKASADISRAFTRLSREELDVIVLTRGGGDIEDLMCFNTEEVVRAIRACPIPVISAVGHEIDYTLSDLAADLRVSTPTKAAELIASSYADFWSELNSLMNLSSLSLKRYVQNFLLVLENSEIVLRKTWDSFKNYPEVLGSLKEALQKSYQNKLSRELLLVDSVSTEVKASKIALSSTKPNTLKSVVIVIFLLLSIFTLITPDLEVSISSQAPFFGKTLAKAKSLPVEGSFSEVK